MRLLALSVFMIALAAPLAAQSTPGPPDWRDGGKSVYLPAAPTAQPSATPAIESAPIATSRKLDFNVAPSAHQEAVRAVEPSGRRLAPPSARQENTKLKDQKSRASDGPRRLIDFGIPTESMYTVATALAIVVGAFLLFAWALRRGSHGKAGRRGILPADAVSVLGRVPLTGRQMAELLRVGNKLVLVAITPGGAETLTEVTDPIEVDRLMGMCQQHDRHSTTKAFEQVFQQLSREPAAGGFLGGDSLPTSISPVAAAYRSQRGGSTRG